MKKLSIVIIVFFTLAISCKHEEKEAKEYYYDDIPIIWQSKSLGSLIIERHNIILPFMFENLEKKWYLMLKPDYSGSFMFYEFFENYATDDIMSNAIVDFETENIVFSGMLGNYYFDNKSLNLKKYFYKSHDSIIGHIDLSFFGNNTLKINFPNNSISVLKSTDKLSKYSRGSYKICSGKVLLPLIIDNREYDFYFLPSSIIYTLLDTQEITENSMLVTTITDIEIESPSVFSSEATFTDSQNFDGIIGHSFFKDNKLYLDLKNKEFFIKTIN